MNEAKEVCLDRSKWKPVISANNMKRNRSDLDRLSYLKTIENDL